MPCTSLQQPAIAGILGGAQVCLFGLGICYNNCSVLVLCVDSSLAMIHRAAAGKFWSIAAGPVANVLARQPQGAAVTLLLSCVSAGVVSCAT